MIFRLVSSLLLLLQVASPVPGRAEASALSANGIFSTDVNFKIKIAQDGVYRLDFSALVAAGHDAEPIPSKTLGLTHRGEAESIWVADGGDGELGPGDWIEFVGLHLRGESSYYDQHTRYNVYWLHSSSEEPLRLATPAKPTEADLPSRSQGYRLVRQVHQEEDALLIRLPSAGTDSSQELWFWQRLVQGHEPTPHTLSMPDLAVTTTAKEPTAVTIRLELRGWSRPQQKGSLEIPDHALDVRLNSAAHPTQIWNGTDTHLVELKVSVDQWLAGDNLLELSVPKRFQVDKKLLVDVILLNWIEVEYPHSGLLSEPQAALTAQALKPAAVRLASKEDSGRLLVFGHDSRHELAPSAEGTWSFQVKAGESRWRALEPSAFLAPASVELDKPSRLSATDRQADYLMISHRRFLPALEPLVELHERLGRHVTVVDVEDVYDEFNDGIVHARALRDFLSHAYHHWQSPAPRFVLLVGDSSWDGKSEQAVDQNYADWTFRSHEREQFAKNESTLYKEGAEFNQRNYIPTWGYGTGEGHAASDNYFVAVDGDDDLPDMAIGRFTVAEPDEVADIVAKTIRYVEQAEPGDWQRKVLFITNEQKSMQFKTERVVETVAEAGFTPLKIYPESTEVSNEQHTSQLIEAFDGGILAVQFLGHGGRYIWRTGPPDLKKNHDLFSLDHLDQLAPTTALPVVLSLTCYSAPFDHPNADSIGEKFLRLPNRGAIGVIAASWRNSPKSIWGQVLMTELTTPGTTIGEALMRAKHDRPHPLFVNTYNLLGDPAVPLALPEARPETDSGQVAAADLLH